ncbi:MAG: hypothetical protein ACFE8G_15965, partial [Candidatus Hermodarchaeota archaeon]
MLFEDLFATDPSMVGIAWFDFYSIGHFCFGIGVFLFFSLFYTIPKHKGKIPIFSLLFVFILTLGILILWEVLENLVFVDLGWKFEGQQDSPQNITTDLIIGSLGGIVSWIFCYEIFVKDKNIWAYYIFGIIGFTLWIVVFMILRAFTI